MVILANRNRGGIANAQGSLYEEFYAVYRVLEAFVALERGQERWLAQQLKGALVDDFVERHGRRSRHHSQLKRRRKLSWKEVADDFRRQLKRGAASVTLVVARGGQAKQLRRSKGRVRQAQVVWFPAAVSPAVLCGRAPVRAVLDALSVKTNPHAADRETLWSAIRLGWDCTRKLGKFVSAKAVLRSVIDRQTRSDSIGSLPLRVPWRSPQGWSRAQRLLAAIPGFHFRIDGGHFLYDDRAGSSGRISCRSPALKRLVLDVLSGRPTTLDELRRYL
jgi:hypothetical protein